MFYNYLSIKSLPNIKNFKLDNVSRAVDIFSECKNLVSIPDLSNWFSQKSNCSPVYDNIFYD